MGKETDSPGADDLLAMTESSREADARIKMQKKNDAAGSNRADRATGRWRTGRPERVAHSPAADSEEEKRR